VSRVSGAQAWVGAATDVGHGDPEMPAGVARVMKQRGLIAFGKL